MERSTFASLGLSPEILKAVDKLGFEEASPIQAAAIPELLAGRDVVGQSQTGSGKTAAFAIPAIEKTDPALHAVQVAAVLRTHLDVVAREIEQRFGKKPQIGVAFSTGPAVCGLFGVSHFESFSAIGEVIDFSAQLSALNGDYGSQVLISARTYSLVKDSAEVRPMEMVCAAGSSQMSEVYEFLGEKGALGEPEIRARDAFWQGVVQYRKGDLKQALASFKSAMVEDREDAPLKYFLERIEAASKEKSAPAKETPKHARKLAAS